MGEESDEDQEDDLDDMSDDEKMKIFAETGIVQDKQTQDKFKELFKGIEC